MNEQKFNKIIENIGKVVIQKNKMYNDSVFKYGQMGIMIHLLDKFERMKHIIFNASRVYLDINARINMDLDLEHEDALIDTILDICGYCLLFLYQETIEKEKDMNGEII